MKAWPLALLLLLAACGEGGGEVARPARLPAPPIPVPTQAARPATPAPAANADAIRGQNARTLIAQFGQPRIDLQEGPARKLQFMGAACVLDIYLYPPGKGEAVATHFDTRLRDGQPANSASCVATLRRIP